MQQTHHHHTTAELYGEYTVQCCARPMSEMNVRNYLLNEPFQQNMPLVWQQNDRNDRKCNLLSCCNAGNM